MILFYSGTGNSAYVAQRIGEQTGDEVVNLFDRIRNHDYSPVKSDRPLVFAAPTYGWQIPHILRDWIENTAFTGNKNAYFAMTCGGSIGNAGGYLKKLCEKKGLTYMGCVEIVMPENYIAMFHAPDKKEALEIISRAEPVIGNAAELIGKGLRLPEKQVGFGGKISSAVVNFLFYPLFVHTRKFYATKECVGCGKCTKLCPLNNIDIVKGKPKWGKNCTHCMSCICGCPREAIEYGRKSQGQPRYQCPANKKSFL